MANKITVKLPFLRETPSTLVFRAPNPKTATVGQIYVRKEDIGTVNGRWPSWVTLTIEPEGTTA